MQAGWFGEVLASDFITGDELASLVGISAGYGINSNEPWLKFAYKNSVLLVAKKPLRAKISWNDINDANCVYGDKTVDINDKKYSIMLMRGIGEDVQPNPKILNQAYDGAACHNSMWNKLMLPIHEEAPSSWAYAGNVKSPTENWNVGYKNKDLDTWRSTTGTACWCQERVNNEFNCLVRGYEDVSHAYPSGYNNHKYENGWRPCLKLIG